MRYVEEFSSKEGHACGIGHHHHSSHRKLKDDNTNGSTDKLLATSEGNLADERSIQKDEKLKESGVLRKVDFIVNFYESLRELCFYLKKQQIDEFYITQRGCHLSLGRQPINY